MRQYQVPCSGLGAKVANYEASLLMYGTGTVGSFTKTYRQYDSSDVMCQGPLQVEYVLNGSYAVGAASTCGGDCTQVGGS